MMNVFSQLFDFCNHTASNCSLCSGSQEFLKGPDKIEKERKNEMFESGLKLQIKIKHFL